MGFKELMSNEVRRIEQALPHSDREVEALSDEDLATHIETLKKLYGELHLVGVHFEGFRRHLENEAERRKANKYLDEYLASMGAAVGFKRRV